MAVPGPARRVAAMTLLALLSAAPLAAQGWIEPLPGRPAGEVTRLRTNVRVRVVDRIATVEVEEWFRNDGATRFGEGDYVYPLPGEAVFSDFSLFQGDRELRGETMDAERARAIYEAIVRRKKDPALIEMIGHGMLRARVFPIQPGETRRMTLRYTQVLDRAGDALQFRYAAGSRNEGGPIEIREGPVPPRMLPRDPASERAIRESMIRHDDPAPLTFTLIAENGGIYRDAFSPTHEVRVTREDGRMEVRPAHELRGDFALFLPFAERPIGLTLITHRPSGEDGFFLLTLSPGEAALSRVPRDVTAVVDVSGSMSGEKIEQARAALRQLLGTLGGGDRFRLIRFASNVSTLDPDWRSASPANIRAGLEWVDDLRAEGGTNISGALEEAFRAPSADGRLPIILFLTDGLPSAGETDPEAIARMAEHAAGDARIFAFGVGYDVNTFLLDRLSAAGRGSTQYVEPGEDVEVALGTLAAKIRHPVLADLTIAGGAARLEEIYPRRLPDLFAGEDLVILGRYRGTDRDVRTRLAVEGRREGRAERYTLDATFARHETGNGYLPRLWASRKIGELQREVRLNGADPELIEEIRSTALRYGLLSEYSSYLVLEPGLDDIVVTGNRPAAPQPAAATGQVAVRSAVLERRAREAKSLADVDAAQTEAEERAGEGGAAAMKRVAGRAFLMVEGEWRDASIVADAQVLAVEPFSEAYFTLLRRLPELEPYWRELDRVTVMGRSLAIRLASGGEKTMNAAELDRVVHEFRSR